jgi:hypothetical protein
MKVLEIFIEALCFVAVGLLVAMYLVEPGLGWLLIPSAVVIGTLATLMSINTYRWRNQ